MAQNDEESVVLPFQTPSGNLRTFSEPGLTAAAPGFDGGGPMDTSVNMKDYVDARDDAIESRLSTKLDKLPTRSTVWGAVATGVGLILAALAFGGDRFDGGVGAGGLLQDQAGKQAATDEAQDAKLELMNQKLDILIKQTADK
ncbi:MAG: hypothetical protein P8J20_11170 [Novosphingobium sp.]|nr:hypothetical protein [Novosphingobium sp.]